MIKIAIVDDEEQTREQILRTLKENIQEQHEVEIKLYASGESFFEEIQKIYSKDISKLQRITFLDDAIKYNTNMVTGIQIRELTTFYSIRCYREFFIKESYPLQLGKVFAIYLLDENRNL